MSYCVVLVTAKDNKEAAKIANGVLALKLAACVNIVKGVDSLFWWQGKIDKIAETLLIIKTTKSCLQKLESAVKSLHSYSTPEFIVLPILSGSKEYLAWIKKSVTVKK